MRYIQYYKDMKEITGVKTSRFIIYTALHIVMEGALLLPPVATAGIIGVLTSGGTIAQIFGWAVFYIVSYAIYTSARTTVWRIYMNTAKQFHINVQKKLLEHITINNGIFDELSRGKVIATCTDDIRWLVDVFDCSACAISKVTNLVIILIIFFVSSFWVAIVALLVNVIYMILMGKNNRNYHKHFDGCRKYEDKTANIINDIAINSNQIRAMNLFPAMLRKYGNAVIKWSEQYAKRRLDREKIYLHDEWMMHLGKIALYIMMAVFVMNGQMTVAMLVLLISYFEQIETTTNELWRDNLRPLEEYAVNTLRVKKLLGFTQKSEVEFGDFDNDYINGLVEFKNVSLKRQGKPVLKNISFKARPNEITVIVGPKGAGKTSIVSLLHRLERVNSGQILIDDENIYNYSKRVHNSNVSGVFQKPFVLDASIRDNLSLVERNHTKQREVCKRIGLDKIVTKLSNGYDTVVTEDESVLSEGDKQLLAIARAILTKAEILIFDEVSSVGAQAIPELPKILEDLKQDHTIIVITHEKDLIKQADRVVELDNGKVKRILKNRKKKVAQTKARVKKN